MKNINVVKICIGFVAAMVISACVSSKNNSGNSMVARMEVKSPIDGVCDQANVIAILPFPGNGQVKAQPPTTKEEITLALNAKVDFLADKPEYEDKGMVGLIINCKGELVKCEIDNKTKSPELDRQIVAVFAELTTWTPGKVNNKPVDTVVLYSFTIKNGKISLT